MDRVSLCKTAEATVTSPISRTSGLYDDHARLHYSGLNNRSSGLSTAGCKPEPRCPPCCVQGPYVRFLGGFSSLVICSFVTWGGRPSAWRIIDELLLIIITYLHVFSPSTVALRGQHRLLHILWDVCDTFFYHLLLLSFILFLIVLHVINFMFL